MAAGLFRHPPHPQQRRPKQIVNGPLQQAASFTADAVIRKPDNAASFTANAVIKREQAASLTADAVIRREQSTSFTANAVIRREQTASFTANAVVFKTQSASFAADAVIKRTQTMGLVYSDNFNRTVGSGIGTASDGTIYIDDGSTDLGSVNGSYYTIDGEDQDFAQWKGLPLVGRGVVQYDFFVPADVTEFAQWDVVVSNGARVQTLSIFSNQNGTYEFVMGSAGGPFTPEASTWYTIKGRFDTHEVLNTLVKVWKASQAEPDWQDEGGTGTAAHTYSMVDLVRGLSEDISIDNASINSGLLADAVIKREQTASFTADAVIEVGGGTVEASFTANAVILRTQAASLTADAVLLRTQSASLTADAAIFRTQAVSLTADAVVFRTQSATLTADAVLKATVAASFTADAIKRITVSASLTGDAVVLRTQTASLAADAVLFRTQSTSVTADAVVVTTISASLTADAVILLGQSASFTADASISRIGKPVWTTPGNNVAMDEQPVLTFLMPVAAGPMHFHIEIDKAATFDGPDYRSYKTNHSQANWEYWDGDSWEPFPAAGVSNSFSGNEARLTIADPLVSGIWYRRVRGGA